MLGLTLFNFRGMCMNLLRYSFCLLVVTGLTSCGGPKRSSTKAENGPNIAQISIAVAPNFPLSLDSINTSTKFIIKNLSTTQAVTLNSITIPAGDSTNYFTTDFSNCLSNSVGNLNAGNTCTVNVVFNSDVVKDTAVHNYNFNVNYNSQSNIVTSPTITGSNANSLPLSPLTPAKKTYAYIANYSSGITKCTVSMLNGSFGDCASAGDVSQFGPANSILLNGQYLYFPNVTSSPSKPLVTKCFVSSKDGSLSKCVDSGASDITLPNAMVINGANAYISNLGTNPNNMESYITKCSVSAIDGSLSKCEKLNVAGLIATREIKIYAQHAYITTYTPAIIVCSISQTDGSLINCGSFQNSTVVNPVRLSFIDSKMYIANAGENSSFATCNVSPDGSISSCATLPSKVDFPYLENFAIKGKNIFYSDYSSSSIKICSLEKDGSINNCADTGAKNINGPGYILINPTSYFLP